MWSRNGKELFFLTLDGALMAVDDFEAGVPHKLFSTRISFVGLGNQYTVTKDGTRFLVNVVEPPSRPAAITVDVDWPALVAKK